MFYLLCAISLGMTADSDNAAVVFGPIFGAFFLALASRPFMERDRFVKFWILA